MKITAKFASNDGNVLIATFDQETHTVVDQTGRKGTYTRAEGSNTLEIDGDEKLSITISNPLEIKAGFTSPYTASNGKAGTMSIESVS